MDVIGIANSQYWLQIDVKATCPQHLGVLKYFYCIPCPCKQSKNNKSPLMVPMILSGWELGVQHGLFKLTMKSNSTQAMAEIMTLAFEKVNPTIVNPPYTYLTSHQCIIIVVSFIFKVCQTYIGCCYGSYFEFY